MLYPSTASNSSQKTASSTRLSTTAILDAIHDAVTRELAANVVDPKQLRGESIFIYIAGLPTEEPGMRHLIERIRQSLCGTFLVGKIELDITGVRLFNDTSRGRSLVHSSPTHHSQPRPR